MIATISQKLIGYRVKAAREAMRWTQDQLTEGLGLKDRQSISDIEHGNRALKPEELLALSDLLDRDIEYFINPFAVAGEAQFSWRAAPALPEEHLDKFELKAGHWVGLLRWLRDSEQGRVSPLKHSLRLTTQSTYEDAIDRAEKLVTELELGRVPAENLTEAIEIALDIPVLFIDTDETLDGDAISGATCHLQDLGVILVSRNESEARRNYNIAHELFHVLTWDALKPQHRESNTFEERGRTRRIEQLADNFASALLMPRNSLENLVDKNRTTEISHLTDVASLLHVSPMALAWRLFNMKWISKPTVNELTQERQDISTACIPKRFSPNFVCMLHRAIDRGQLSARKAAKTMSMDLSHLSTLFTEHSLSPPFDL